MRYLHLEHNEPPEKEGNVFFMNMHNTSHSQVLKENYFYC